MRILMINASPKKQNSASGELVNNLKACFSQNTSLTEYKISTGTISEDIMNYLNAVDVLVIAFPLYVDGIPAHLLSCLCQIEEKGISNKQLKIYGIANCGFYEGKQNALALEILENWCDKIGATWGQAVGLGGGGGLAQMSEIPLGKSLKKNLGTAFETLAKNIENGESAENIYVSLDMPRFLYKMAGEMGWRTAIKENGLDVKDLSRKCEGIPAEK